MSYNEKLDNRIAAAVAGMATTRKKMFGGTGFLLNGSMFCGVWKDYLIVRLGDVAADAALQDPHVRPFDITGRPMRGWIMVAEDGYAGPQLELWIEKALGFVKTLPPK